MLAFLAVIGAVLSYIATLGIVQVDEGYVAVYYLGGKLSNSYSLPGIHYSLPFVTHHDMIPVKIRTINVPNVECGTSGGVRLIFERIEVVTRLRLDSVVDTVRNYTADYTHVWIDRAVYSLVNQWCTKHNMMDIYIKEFDRVDDAIGGIIKQDLNRWAPGIEIIAIRVTKPRIPESIRKIFDVAENTRSKLRVVEQHEQNVVKKIESDARKEIHLAEKDLALSKMNNERKMDQLINAANIAMIENDMFIAREREKTNAIHYAQLQEIESNKRTLTPDFLKLQRILAMSHNIKYYLGSRVPTSIYELDGDHPVEPHSIMH